MNANDVPTNPLTPTGSPAQRRNHLLATVALATTSGVMLLALTAASIGNLAAGDTAESGITPGNLPYAQIAITTLLLLSPVFVATLTPLQPQYGVQMPSTLPRFVAAAALAWFAMGVMGVANPWVRHWIGHAPWAGFSPTREIADGEMVFLAINAGVAEEAAYTALPFGVTYLAGYGLNLVLAHFRKPTISGRRLLVAAIVITVLFSAFHRFAGHLYQGQVSAFFGIVWGVALAAVFVWVRSIWPLMLGHAIYDLPTHYTTWTGVISHHVIAPAVIAGLALWWGHRATRGRANPA